MINFTNFTDEKEFGIFVDQVFAGVIEAPIKFFFDEGNNNIVLHDDILSMAIEETGTTFRAFKFSFQGRTFVLSEGEADALLEEVFLELAGIAIRSARGSTTDEEIHLLKRCSGEFYAARGDLWEKQRRNARITAVQAGPEAVGRLIVEDDPAAVFLFLERNSEIDGDFVLDALAEAGKIKGEGLFIKEQEWVTNIFKDKPISVKRARQFVDEGNSLWIVRAILYPVDIPGIEEKPLVRVRSIYYRYTGHVEFGQCFVDMENGVMLGNKDGVKVRFDFTSKPEKIEAGMGTRGYRATEDHYRVRVFQTAEKPINWYGSARYDDQSIDWEGEVEIFSIVV